MTIWAPAQETAGMSARHLPVAVFLPAFGIEVLGVGQAGQGAYREVGSEGCAAKHRAVAEPVGQIPGETPAGTMAVKEVLGRIKVCAGGTVRKEHTLPPEVSYGPGPDGARYLGV